MTFNTRYFGMELFDYLFIFYLENLLSTMLANVVIAINILRTSFFLTLQTYTSSR